MVSYDWSSIISDTYHQQVSISWCRDRQRWAVHTTVVWAAEAMAVLAVQRKFQTKVQIGLIWIYTKFRSLSIGQLIVEDAQSGEARAEYGKTVLKEISDRLTQQFGKGFDISNLRYMRRFYLAFPIRDALRPDLSWTHYRLLLKVESEVARQWYMREASLEGWSTRALERQINSFYHERLLSSQDEVPVRAEAKQTAQALSSPITLIHQRYIHSTDESVWPPALSSQSDG